ncbi:MAG: hypothetical protein N2689_13915, partial [Verrucomicrobiae bacterium]|nr:hypothetical protein [Verrucomicrobiae bacterium]
MALIGTSRFLTGLDPAVMNREIAGRRFFQLAIEGSCPFPVLEDLAKDPKFSGDVVCEVYPALVFRSTTAEHIPRVWLDAFHHRAWTADIETQLRILLQERLTLELATVTPTAVLRALLQEHRLPEPNPGRIRADRFVVADYDRVDVSRRLRALLANLRSVEDALTETQLRQRCAQINKSVSAIQRRGGQVVFLRMVSSGELYEEEERRFPPEKHWNVFVR